MSLVFLDQDQLPLARANFVVSGRYGGVHEQLLYIRNNDPARYYANLSVVITGSQYDALSEFGTSGWSLKLLYGQRRPTEAEWDLIRSGESLDLPDIGNSGEADTSTLHPVWVRVYCPAHEQATNVDDFSIELQFIEHMVLP